jgi:hypothetical protein
MAMGLPVSSSSKAAVAFPREVADLILIEDDAASLANKLVDLIDKEPRPPLAAIRAALLSIYGDDALRRQLNEIVEKAVTAKPAQVKLAARSKIAMGRAVEIRGD